MKKHWFTIIGYFLIVMAVWGCIAMLQQPFLLILLFILIILPCLSLFFFYIAIPKLEFHAYSETPAVETGNKVLIFLECKNKSFFPFFACEYVFTLQNLYNPNDIQHKVSLPVLPKRNNKIQIPVETARSGLLSMEISVFSISDYLHFVTKEILLSLRIQVPVLPPTTDVSLPSTAPVSDGMDEYTENDNKGNLSSDIKEIREYRPGDRLQRIHWKLSAKLDELLVKEMAHTTTLSLVVLPECNRNCIDDTASVLRSVMEELWKREERFEVCLYNHGACEFNYFLITEENQIMECLIHFFYMPLYDDGATAKDMYFSSYQKAATILHINGTNLVRLDSENIIG